MISRIALAAMLAAFAVPALGQTVTAIVPSKTVGYGTLSVAGASVALSTLTLGPSSAVFPTGNLPNGYMTVRNAVASANTVFLCEFGGTCTTANGIPLANGESKTFSVSPTAGSLTSPTVISGGTATVTAEW